MRRALAWAVLAFIACTALGLPLLPALVVTVIATMVGT